MPGKHFSESFLLTHYPKKSDFCPKSLIFVQKFNFYKTFFQDIFKFFAPKLE